MPADRYRVVFEVPVGLKLAVVRRLLKNMLRSYGLKCVSIERVK